MKRMKSTDAKCSFSCPSKRRGALFHYYLAYVTLVSSVLMMSGTCLHSILRSEQSDQRISMYLQALMRCERMLREDAGTISSPPIVESESALSMTRRDGIRIQWNSDRGILTRTESQNDSQLQSDRFIFPAGSQIKMNRQDDGATVLRFVEPSIFVKYSTVGSGALNRNKHIDEAMPANPDAAIAPHVTEIVLR